MNLEHRPSVVRAYIFAAVCVGVAFFVRWALGGILQEHAPLMFFMMAAILASWYGGWGPGLVAIAGGVLLGDYFFIAPMHTFGPRGPAEWIYWLSFIAVTVGMVGVVEALRRSQRQAVRSLNLAQTRGEQVRETIREIGEAEIKLRQLAAVVESADDAIVSLGLDGEVKSWNPGAERLFGYTAAEMRGHSWLRLIPEKLHEEFKASLKRLAQNERVEAYETLRLRKDGREVPVLVSLSPVRDNAGKVIGASSITRNTAELKKATAAVREQNEALAASRHELEAERSRYRELFNSAPVGYVITDPRGLIQQVNTVALSMLNRKPEDLRDKSLGEFLAKESQSIYHARLNGLATAEAVENWETMVQPASGESFPCLMLANRMEDEKGRFTGLRWILRDITERKHAEERILRLNSELEKRVRERTSALEAANRELESFSYSVSHDLRAPLRSVVGFSKALVEDYSDKLDAEGLTYLRCSYEAGLRMSRLIEDLLGLSRASRVELQHCEVDISMLAETVLAEFARREPGRKVEVSIEPGLIVHGDEGLIRIALENLLGNAWKFTGRKAEPKIEVGAVEHPGKTVFFVRDNGAGFSMAHAERLFGVFQRFHLQDEFPGTGIGLATVRRIFNRHGGEVWAQSKVDEGATFYFTVPERREAFGAREQEAEAA